MKILLHRRQSPGTLALQQGAVAWLLVFLIALGGVLGIGYVYRDQLGQTRLGEFLHLHPATPSTDIYYCPMHPQVQSNKPGTCPICNMDLVKKAPEKEAAAKAKDRYYCPMHPQIQSNKPGTCPICNMNLEKRLLEREALPPQKTAVAAQAKDLYYCPMHPQVQSNKPGTCPICNMDLVKKQPEEEAPAGGALPPGTVRIKPEMQQLIGVEYGEVVEQQLSKTILTVGRLAYDETKIVRIQTRIDGWIEKVFVDFAGMLVKKGQPLLSVYSPELFSAQQELLIARKTMETLAATEFKDLAANAEALYRSTRERLRLWNISEGELKQMEARGTPLRALTFNSPIGGFVIARNAYPGQRIAPDTELYSIADLATVWVLADVFEYEVANIHLGQTATMTLASFPGETYTGAVSYVYPMLDGTSRTLKIRLQFPNPGFKLKPDMWANVSVKIDYGRKLAIPGSAVLDSGTEQIVFVALGDGYFEPRKIQLGARVGDLYAVVGGLQRGERIVTSGNFLIDSESRLKSALSGMGSPEHAGHGGSPPSGEARKDSVSSEPGTAPGGHAGHH